MRVLRRIVVLAAVVVVIGATAVFASPGDLDPSFGSGGTAVVPMPAPASPLAMAVQPNGRIIVGGDTGSHALLVGLTPSGAIDPTFGTGGFAATALDAVFTALDVQADGTIVGIGAMRSGNFAARFHPDGTPDRSFGTNGVAPTGRLAAASVDADGLGRIVVGGWSCVVELNYCERSVQRLLPNGTIDPTFPDPEAGRSDLQYLWSVRVQRNGRVVVGKSFALDGYTTLGTPDPTFGVNGTVALPFFSGASTMDGAGRTIAVGQSDIGERPLIGRFLADGRPDPTFGQNGVVNMAMDDLTDFRQIGILPDGRIVLAGRSCHPDPTCGPDFTDLVQLMPNGALDTTFGTNGRVELQVGHGPTALAVQPDSGVVLTGGYGDDLQVQRLLER